MAPTIYLLPITYHQIEMFSLVMYKMKKMVYEIDFIPLCFIHY